MAAKKKVAGKQANRPAGRSARRGPDTGVPRCTTADDPNACYKPLGRVPSVAQLHEDVHDYMYCMCVYLHDLRQYIEGLENRIRTHCCPALPSPGPSGVPKPPPPPF